MAIPDKSERLRRVLGCQQVVQLRKVYGFPKLKTVGGGSCRGGRNAKAGTDTATQAPDRTQIRSAAVPQRRP
jgi:hypothetical protein